MPPPIGLPSPFFRCPFATDHPGVVSIAMGIKYSRRIKRSAACSHARRRATTRASNVTPWPRLASLARSLARSRRYPSRGRPREHDLSGSRDNPTVPYRGARGKKGKEKEKEKEEEEKKGARTEAKEEERSSFLSARSSRFLSGLDSRNRHKSRHFIICGGRHGWRYDRVKNSLE